jgi:glycosyltransferase involved in cell wall biosynthesis
MCLRGSSQKSRIYRALLLPGLRRAERAQIVAISKQTAVDLLDLLPSLSDRLTVIPHGHTPGRFSPAERRHIFMFGGHGEPRKRIDLGLAAYGRYRECAGSAALPLVIAGRGGVDRSSVLRNLNDGPVDIHPDPSEAQVLRLLGEAACVIYPSAEEGFGLPIVEAGEVGTPVVYDRLARIPTEPLGLHTLGVEGPNIEQWAEAIRAAVEGGPVPNALAHLPTWAEAARAYINLYGITANVR